MTKQNAYGEPVPASHLVDPDRLMGLAEIGEYSGFKDSRTLRTLLETSAFPMALIGGCWFSSKSLVTAWRQEQIRHCVRQSAGKT